MKQVMQDLQSGKTFIVEAPVPNIKEDSILVETSNSLISSGTERMLIKFGRANLFRKAMLKPDKLKLAIEKLSTEGLITTIDSVKSKLAQPIPLGYCNVGRITEIGKNVRNFKIGDRVVSNGSHADIVIVGKNLCAKIPETVDDEEAAFTVLASIGLQGVRLAKPTLGEFFVVIGVGLIGLLTVQILIAHGCSVLAIDYDEAKLALAEQFGAKVCNIHKGEDPVSAGFFFSQGKGVDAVIITATTESNKPIKQAAQMCRKRGRVILVGVTGLELNRDDFYEKELYFQVSCSYGPGRYDPLYEEKGHDYPLSFVRWTEQRNFEAILMLLANKKLNVKPLISHRFFLEEVSQAYESLIQDKTNLGIILKYKKTSKNRKTNNISLKKNIKFDNNQPIIGFIGAGNYASRILLPVCKKMKLQLHTLVTENGINSVIHGRHNGFSIASSDSNKLISNHDINTVVVVTRHNTHANFVTKSLKAGKNVFVEKPLAIDDVSLDEIENTYMNANDKKNIQLMVGFNRRFSTLVQEVKRKIEIIKEPKTFIITVNAGFLPNDHWTQDADIGGGRIIGEACHFIDLIRYLSGSEIISAQANCLKNPQSDYISEDTASITLGFADGSFGTILYLSNGNSNFPKERVEIFVDGKILQIDNFRKLKSFGWKGFKNINLWKQDKGQKSCMEAFVNSIKSGQPAIPPNEIFEVARVCIKLSKLLRS